MSDRFFGIDPPALADLALQLDWIAADIDVQAGRAHANLVRHSSWAVADRAGSRLTTSANWARTSSGDLRQRATAMTIAQQADPLRARLSGEPWWRWAGPLPRAGPDTPGYPIGNPLGFLGEADIPWGEIEDWLRGALGVWNGSQDDTFPIGRWVAGLLYVNRVAGFLRADRAVPTVANGWVMRRLADTRYVRWLNNPFVQTVGRRVSIGLGFYSTISDAIVVYEHGNPIDAFEQEKAGYVADMARLGFSASTTAFLVAPNPITGGVVIATGVVWAGAEVVDHWDEITEFWGETYADIEAATEWVYDQSAGVVADGWNWTAGEVGDATDRIENRLGDGYDWAADQVNAIQDWTHGQIDNLSRGWDWTTGFIGDRGAEVVDAGEEFVARLVTAPDYAGERLEDARDWAGKRVANLVDVGGGIVGGGIDIGKKLIPGW
jgi:hypothetical protein